MHADGEDRLWVHVREWKGLLYELEWLSLKVSEKWSKFIIMIYTGAQNYRELII